MKILWLTGIVIPQASTLVDGPKVPFGGWVSQMIDQLSKKNDFTIGVAMKSTLPKLKIMENDGVTYYFLPENKTNKFDVYHKDCLEVISHFSPDLIHAEGAELKYTYTFLNSWKGKNVVSMQGILNGYEPYEYGNIDIYKHLFSFNFKNIVFAALLILNKKTVFKRRALIEKRTIALANNILGRTLWDRANSYFYNREAPYFHSARILRPSFYKIVQEVEHVIPHSVFIGNAAQPRKGAHFVVEAIALLKLEYPDIKLYVTGNRYDGNIRDWKSYFGYRSFLQRQVSRLGINDYVEFLGVLPEQKMAEQLSRMNVYIMSSVIENSPNTLGEAMIMGVPCVSSFNGGIADMATNEMEALHYRENDPRMLAYQIKRVFEDKDLVKSLRDNGMKKARITHNPEKNLQDLIDCYKTILS
jgi:glycosyltransferase involved in cell wall biosynthesis